MTPSEILCEVLDGKSEILYGKDEVAYFKHPTIIESLKEQKEYKQFEERAKNAGLSTEDELIDAACFGGKWSEEKESRIKDLLFSNDGLRRVLLKQQDPSMKARTEEKIHSQQLEIDELKKERNSLIRGSLENYILINSTIHFCSKRIFDDKECLNPAKNIDVILDSYNLKLAELIKRENLLKAAFYPSFFDLFFLYGDSPYMIINKSGDELTVFQKDLLVYGHILNQKLKSQDIPKIVKNDPVQLYNFDLNTKNNKKQRTPDEIEENFDPRKFVEKAGGLEKLDAEHLAGLK